MPCDTNAKKEKKEKTDEYNNTDDELLSKLPSL